MKKLNVHIESMILALQRVPDDDDKTARRIIESFYIVSMEEIKEEPKGFYSDGTPVPKKCPVRVLNCFKRECSLYRTKRPQIEALYEMHREGVPIKKIIDSKLPLSSQANAINFGEEILRNDTKFQDLIVLECSNGKQPSILAKEHNALCVYDVCYTIRKDEIMGNMEANILAQQAAEGF